jgi:hypothetical protein
MRSSLSALFCVFLFASVCFATQDNILEMIDRTPEGKEILNAVQLQLQATGPNLNRGKLFQVLKTCKYNVNMSENNHKSRVARLSKGCKNDLGLLSKFVSQNENAEYTIERHWVSNEHAQNKNNEYIARSKSEFNNYQSLANLLTANRAAWKKWQKGNLNGLKRIVSFLRTVRKQLRAQHKIASGDAFIQMTQEYSSSLSQLKVEFTSNDNHYNGLRPVIASLIQIMSERSHVSKSRVRVRLISTLKNILKALHQQREALEVNSESMSAKYEALLKSINENKIRIQKLQVRLVHERNFLVKRGKSLSSSHDRARSITNLSKAIEGTRWNQCRVLKKRNAQLYVALQKMKNIVAQIEEILQERFGEIKTYFLETRK